MVLTKHDNRMSLFVQTRTSAQIQWDGPCIGADHACSEYGADATFGISELPTRVRELLSPCEAIFISRNTESRLPSAVLNALPAEYHDRIQLPNRLLQQERSVKTPYEIEQIKHACDLTSNAFIQVMKDCKVGMKEYQVGALFEYHCKYSGAEQMAFPQVVATGSAAATIHYAGNSNTIQAGELLLVDAGCQVNGYVSDVTRTWPISKSFTAIQRQVYEIVLKCQYTCLELLSQCHRRDISLQDIHQCSVRELTKGLLELGWIKNSTEYSAYYPTYIGHFLGLDVHDTPQLRRNEPLRPNMVITIEPGLYNPDLGIGIRIEDDILITANGIEVLTEKIPKDICDL